MCGLFVLSCDSDNARAQAVLNATIWLRGEENNTSGRKVGECNKEETVYVQENEMAASLASVLKLVLSFDGVRQSIEDVDLKQATISPEFLAAHLTVEAYSRAGAAKLVRGEYYIDPRIFCDWIAGLYRVIDGNAFRPITDANHENFLSAVVKEAIIIMVDRTQSIHIDFNEDDDDDEGGTEIPTDQSLAGDSVTITSGSANSISNAILEDIDNAR